MHWAGRIPCTYKQSPFRRYCNAKNQKQSRVASKTEKKKTGAGIWMKSTGHALFEFEGSLV